MLHRQSGSQVAADLIKRLEAVGMSRAEIARQIGRSRQTIWRLVNNECRETGAFTIQRLQKLAEKTRAAP